MIFEAATSPQGTVKDWLDARAESDGVAIVFPETGAHLDWRSLRDSARDMAQGLVGLGVAQGESVAIVHPNGKEGVLALYAALITAARASPSCMTAKGRRR